MNSLIDFHVYPDVRQSMMETTIIFNYIYETNMLYWINFLSGMCLEKFPNKI